MLSILSLGLARFLVNSHEIEGFLYSAQTGQLRLLPAGKIT